MADFANIQPDEYMYVSNYSAGRPWGIKYITIHHMAGDLDGAGCARAFNANGTSAHYSVDRNGKIVQHVDDWNRAYACGDGIGGGSGGNDCSISIEHANNATGPWTVYENAIENGAHLVAALCHAYNLGRPQWMVNVFPHKHWSSTACPGELAGSQNAHYMERAQAWYDAMSNGTSAPAQPATPAQPQMPARTNTGCPTVRYAMHVRGGDWLDEVQDFGDGDNGFAGLPFHAHDLLYMNVSRGVLKYSVHTHEDGWLDPVYKGDRNDTVNGCAGIPGHTIDGVQAYYTTPEGETYKQVWYRAQDVDHEGWWPGVCDDGTTYGGDTYAGYIGHALDRLQVCIADGNPF